MLGAFQELTTKSEGEKTRHNDQFICQLVFVSMDDFYAWEINDDMPYTSVSVFHLKEAARILANNNSGLAVFYDPISWLDHEEMWSLNRGEGESVEAYRARRAAYEDELDSQSRAESEQLLRQQAEAFLLWLRAEGIISSK